MTLGNILSKNLKGNKKHPQAPSVDKLSRNQQEKLLLGAKTRRCIYEIMPLKRTSVYQGILKVTHMPHMEGPAF